VMWLEIFKYQALLSAITSKPLPASVVNQYTKHLFLFQKICYVVFNGSFWACQPGSFGFLAHNLLSLKWILREWMRILEIFLLVTIEVVIQWSKITESLDLCLQCLSCSTVWNHRPNPKVPHYIKSTSCKCRFGTIGKATQLWLVCHSDTSAVTNNIFDPVRSDWYCELHVALQILRAILAGFYLKHDVLQLWMHPAINFDVVQVMPLKLWQRPDEIQVFYAWFRTISWMVHVHINHGIGWI